MSQQWEYRTVEIGSGGGSATESEVNAALATWAVDGWELVNGSYGTAGSVGFSVVWLFWRRPR
jgi:hypothetical protein